MLKYKELINRLTESQKILILTDIQSLSRREFKRLGLPALKTGNIDEYANNIYPCSVILANSWNKELWSSVASDLLWIMEKDGVELATLPSPKIKINPYRCALSEDPMLASDISREYLASAKARGMSSCLEGYSLERDELEWLDDEPNERVIREMVVKPYSDAVKDTDCSAIMTGSELGEGGYKKKNIELIESEKMSEFKFSICKKASAADTVSMIQKGIICFKASGFELEKALKRYEELRRFVDKGDASVAELEEEISLGNAISPEAVDMAIGKVFDFINVCREKKENEMSAGAVRDRLAIRAVKESAVLLKNKNKILPVSANEKVFIIGDIRTDDGESVAKLCENILIEKGYDCIGMAQGYEIDKDRSEMSLGEAYNLSEKADKIILLLGRDQIRDDNVAKTRDLKLPANQEALAHRLMMRGKNVVAVVSTGCGFDISAVEGFDSVMLMALNTKFSANALVDIVTGEFNPSGRLSCSLYRNTNHSFKKQRHYRRIGNKVGGFIGYRYYDSANYDVGFPFGHGIGFSDFVYSKPKINGTTITFTLKNVGRYAGTETVQMYVGTESSAILRPEKELIGYTKVSLNAGESRQISMEISLPAVYDVKTNGFVKEAARYNVYIGASVSDIRLTLKYAGGDCELAGDGEDIIDYLQSRSNILRDKYTLEANYELMKRTVRNIISGVILIVLAVFLRVYCHSNAIDSDFLNVFSLALALVSAGFFIMEIADRMRIASEEKILIQKANQEHFEDAVTTKIFSTEQMFREEFENDAEEEIAHAFDLDDLSEEYLAYVDDKFDFLTATKEFALFASERGCKLDANTVREIFASISSSRLMIVNGMSEDDFELLMKVLCEYFRSEVHIDKVDESYTDEGSVLFEGDAEHKKREAMLAIEAARAERPKMHLLGLTNVKFADMANYFAPFVKYAKSPNGHNSVTVGSGRNANTYYIPKNIWLVLNLASGENVENIPESVSEVSSLCNIVISKCEVAEIATSVHKFYYYQIDFLSDRIAAKCDVNESEWKKLDSFSAFVNGYVPFAIGNKQWIGIERYIAVFEGCGGDADVAFDRALAVRLIPSVISAASKAEKRIDLIDGINTAFGDSEISACRKVIKDSAKNRSQASQ